MNRLVKITFEYEGGKKECIDDVRTCALFQSRCNSSGILAGIEHMITDENKQETST